MFYETEGVQHGGGYDMGVSLRNPSNDKVSCKLYVFNSTVNKILSFDLAPLEVKAFMLSTTGIPEGFYQAYFRGTICNTVWLMREGNVQAAVKIPVYAL